MEGFYNDVRNITAEDQNTIGDFPFDESKDLKGTGGLGPFGEPGFSTLERR